MTQTPVKITRVANACVLIEMGNNAILTDPFFDNWPMIGIKEKVAIPVKELPPLTAIIGCHSFIDHFQMSGLEEYRHNKDDVRVFVSMPTMVKRARKFGFRNAEVLQWSDLRSLGDGLSIEAVEAQKMLVWRVNNYVLRCGDASVFFGSEARDIKPLEDFNAKNGPVDVALLPTNWVHLFGFYPLVMSGTDAVKATKVLGADALIVIHDAHPKIPGMIHIHSSGDDADAEAARMVQGPEVVRIPTGTPWTKPRNTSDQAVDLSKTGTA